MIIDAHTHIASDRFIPRAFIEGVVENLRVSMSARGIDTRPSQLMHIYLAKCQDHTGDAFVADMDRAGVDHAVVLLPDFTFAMPEKDGLSISESIEAHASIATRHSGRLSIFAGVDPRWGQEGFDVFERAVACGKVQGLKLYPPCGYEASDRSLYPFYEICDARRLPVLIHTGPTSPVLPFTPAMPHTVDRAALDFPSVSFILAHGGIRFVEECAAMCGFRPNVYLDISGYPSLPSAQLDSKLRDLFSRGITHKVIFGTDWPLFATGGEYGVSVDAVAGTNGPLNDLDPHERALVLGDTISRLLPGGILSANFAGGGAECVEVTSDADLEK